MTDPQTVFVVMAKVYGLYPEDDSITWVAGAFPTRAATEAAVEANRHLDGGGDDYILTEVPIDQWGRWDENFIPAAISGDAGR